MNDPAALRDGCSAARLARQQAENAPVADKAPAPANNDDDLDARIMRVVTAVLSSLNVNPQAPAAPTVPAAPTEPAAPAETTSERPTAAQSRKIRAILTNPIVTGGFKVPVAPAVLPDMPICVFFDRFQHLVQTALPLVTAELQIRWSLPTLVHLMPDSVRIHIRTLTQTTWPRLRSAVIRIAQRDLQVHKDIGEVQNFFTQWSPPDECLTLKDAVHILRLDIIAASAPVRESDLTHATDRLWNNYRHSLLVLPVLPLLVEEWIRDVCPAPPMGPDSDDHPVITPAHSMATNQAFAERLLDYWHDIDTTKVHKVWNNKVGAVYY